MRTALVDRELRRVAQKLDDCGYALTSFDALEQELDVELASQLCELTACGEFSASAAELTERIKKQKMTMIQHEDAIAIGGQIVRSAVETIFNQSQRALQEWRLYALNRYEKGGSLGAHQDSVGSTVIVITISGQRILDIYRKERKYELFREIECSFTLNAGSMMILDGESDPGHAVRCTRGPSVSAVVDVPDLLRL